MNEAFEHLRTMLIVKPRSRTALDEASSLKRHIVVTSRCFNCESTCTYLESDDRHNGVCKRCGAVYSSMLVTKNKLIARDWVGTLAMQRYRDRLATMKYIPVSLRGNESLDSLIQAFDDCIVEAEQGGIV